MGPIGAQECHASEAFNGRLAAEEIYVDEDGYDNHGSYWGLDLPLWRVSGEDEEELVEEYHRAMDSGALREIVAAKYPRAKLASVSRL